MNESLRQLVFERAAWRCEYCHPPQRISQVPFAVDHIIAIKHRGKTLSRNLALSCFLCNSAKGSNIAGIDPITEKLVQLFNPRRHSWPFHFRWDGPNLVGRTAMGRATVETLGINDELPVAMRESLMEELDFLWD